MATKTKKAIKGKATAEKVAKHADLRAKTPDELKDQLVSLKKEQFNLRFQRAVGQQEGVGRVRQVRRQIARVKTIQNDRARQAASK